MRSPPCSTYGVRICLTPSMNRLLASVFVEAHTVIMSTREGQTRQREIKFSSCLRMARLGAVQEHLRKFRGRARYLRKSAIHQSAPMAPTRILYKSTPLEHEYAQRAMIAYKNR